MSITTERSNMAVETYSRSVEDLVDIFDFFTVRQVMAHIGQEYAKSLEVSDQGQLDFKTAPPTIDDLKGLARELLEQALVTGKEVSSGGFRAEKFKDTLRLSFTISDLEVDIETGAPIV